MQLFSFKCVKWKLVSLVKSCVGGHKILIIVIILIFFDKIHPAIFTENTLAFLCFECVSRRVVKILCFFLRQHNAGYSSELNDNMVPYVGLAKCNCKNKKMSTRFAIYLCIETLEMKTIPYNGVKNFLVLFCFSFFFLYVWVFLLAVLCNWLCIRNAAHVIEQVCTPAGNNLYINSLMQNFWHPIIKIMD